MILFLNFSSSHLELLHLCDVNVGSALLPVLHISTRKSEVLHKSGEIRRRRRCFDENSQN